MTTPPVGAGPDVVAPSSRCRALTSENVPYIATAAAPSSMTNFFTNGLLRHTGTKANASPHEGGGFAALSRTLTGAAIQPRVALEASV
jgi:hypothetical protein